MWLTVSGRWSIIEGISWAFFSGIDRFLEDVIFFPERYHFFFSVHEGRVFVYFLIHGVLPFSKAIKKAPSCKGRSLKFRYHLIQLCTFPMGFIQLPLTQVCGILYLYSFDLQLGSDIQ